MINLTNVDKSCCHWLTKRPFPHFVVENFFEDKVARQLEFEFPKYDDDIWFHYGNELEEKKLCNNWNVFPPLTYRVFSYLNSSEFVNRLSEVLFGDIILEPDYGLNGGGWHIHSRGGKLNTHLDYSLHPKLALQRKLNLIVYLNSHWAPEWGGSLGLWGNESDSSPGNLIKEIEPKFNRAVVFDTTLNSWHGLPEPLCCPSDQFRKSIAVYYLVRASAGVDKRGKALFAPTENQKNNQDILDLIEKRAKVSSAASVYRKKEPTGGC